MRFEFATASKIIFGDGVLDEIGALAAQLGRRALVVTGAHPERAGSVLDKLAAANIAYTMFSVDGEPSVEDALAGVQEAHAGRCDVVIAIGGGSAIDTGKAIAALAANPGDIFDYLEVIGKGLPLTKASLPVIAIPTTAGTGSEVTRNAVLFSAQHHVKVSLRSASMLPRVALVDPLLTRALPPAVTAYTGLDALTQLIEPFVSARANPMTDAICREGLQAAVRSLQAAYDHGDDLDARRDMAFASLCGGLALANAGLGAVHGFAGPFGGMYDAPHGAICAALLPFVFDANVRALLQRAPESPAVTRYQELAAILTGNTGVTPADAVLWLKGLCRSLDVPRLSEYGFALSDAPALIAKAQVASSMKANPIPLTGDELSDILASAV